MQMRQVFGKKILISAWVLAMILYKLSCREYYPIGFFTNRWIYLFCGFGVLYWSYLLSLRHFFKHFAVQISLIGLFILSFFTGHFLYIAYLPAGAIMYLGFEKQVLAQKDKYCLMIINDVPLSGGGADYCIFEKKKLGIQRIYISWGPISSQKPKLEIRESKPWLILHIGDKKREIDIWEHRLNKPPRVRPPKGPRAPYPPPWESKSK